jgi:hypothetical protein
MVVEILGLSMYLFIAIICGTLLIVIALLGGDFGVDLDTDVDLDIGTDVDVGGFDAGLSPLSLPVVLTFGTCFGGFGAMFEALEYGKFTTPLLSAAISAGISALLYVIIERLFVKTQATSSVKLRNLIGMDAVTSIQIKEGQQGQIVVITEERGRTLLPAISEEDIGTDQTVIIESFAGEAAIVRTKKIGGR